MLRIAQDTEADELLTRDPFALLAGMLLDQQFPMERAFAGPALLAGRMHPDVPAGRRSLDPHELAGVDDDRLTAWMAGPPAVHRYPGSMGQRLRALAAEVVGTYGGDTTRLWTDPGPDGAPVTGMLVRRRLEALPGFGKQKAAIFLALLGKQLGVRPPGWREAAGDYGRDDVRRSVADVRDAETLQQVRDTKKELKAQARAGRPG
ncbi:HhH-GPD-type base excision DNA repair protein [Thalassiella azotivora]